MPAWAGFKLVRGSNVVRNLHLEAPLSAALANGDDTLSSTADCYSIAAADAALAAALLAYYTLADYRTASAQDTQTQATSSRPTRSPRRWWRTAQPPTRTRPSSIAAALLSYYTIAQVDGLLAGKLGVAEAASALEISVRFPDEPTRWWPPSASRSWAPQTGRQRLQRPGHPHRGRSERGRLHPDPRSPRPNQNSFQELDRQASNIAFYEPERVICLYHQASLGANFMEAYMRAMALRQARQDALRMRACFFVETLMPLAPVANLLPAHANR